LILHCAKVEESFEAHISYLYEAINEGTKATQLMEVKLRSESLGMGQEDATTDTLEEYVVVLRFELSQRKLYTIKIVLGARA
ncbi:hypothetical protein GW17_00007719, partial [Ensete ventricosum]